MSLGSRTGQTNPTLSMYLSQPSNVPQSMAPHSIQHVQTGIYTPPPQTGLYYPPPPPQPAMYNKLPPPQPAKQQQNQLFALDTSKQDSDWNWDSSVEFDGPASVLTPTPAPTAMPVVKTNASDSWEDWDTPTKPSQQTQPRVSRMDLKRQQASKGNDSLL